MSNNLGPGRERGSALHVVNGVDHHLLDQVWVLAVVSACLRSQFAADHHPVSNHQPRSEKDLRIRERIAFVGDKVGYSISVNGFPSPR